MNNAEAFMKAYNEAIVRFKDMSDEELGKFILTLELAIEIEKAGLLALKSEARSRWRKANGFDEMSSQ